MRNVIAAALVAAAPPLAAGAETCPTSSDLATGITLSSTQTPFRMENIRTEDSLLVTAVNPGETGDQRTPMTFTHPLALPVDSPLVSAIYDTAPDALDNLMTLQTWTSAVDVQGVGRADHTVALSGFGSATLGDCTYDVWRIDVTIAFEDGFTRRLQQVYAPTLGLVVAEYVLDNDGNTIAGLAFDQITAD